MLVKAYIQHRSTIISTHEDDRPNTEDYNILMYDFEGAGYTVRSVQSWLYGLFLSYKIERPMLPARDEDRRFSLNAMTPTPTPLEDCEVELDEPKLDYLQREKSGSLRKAELHTLSAADIAEQVRDKLTSNYVYNLARTTDDQILKFNVVLENPGVARYLCALEYMPEQRKLRIITLF